MFHTHRCLSVIAPQNLVKADKPWSSVKDAVKPPENAAFF
ncbi:hypothetical protein AVDCRST_MAG81-4712 [uncultured Synechococcales cyanobacterium]|uniref:Uncharacterized protein n=1 Tax=uncultured Synechococcales cyanobacterium TaxID=1936017 RepID=A0A6J4VY42_9CYAN|nr:hypothetical protein AVDCRST_MAG81-4712 [uncultured Synechococcales cyanobacterium]